MIEEQTLSQKQIVSIQQNAWFDTFRYAFSKSPFYREHLRKAGLSPDKPPPLDDIGIIPPVDKVLLSEKTSDFLCVPQDKIIDIVTTSGSTGKPLIAALTEADMQRLAYNEYLSFRCVGLSASDTVILAVTLDRCFIAGMAYFLGLRMLGASVIRVGASTPMMHLEIIQRVKPTAIVGVPSFLCMLAEKAREERLDLSSSSVTKAVCIGEPIRQNDFTVNRLGATIEKTWQARVFSTYGNTELASSLCECEAGKGGHLHPELMYMEILDDEGNPLPDGTVGELVATTFGIEAMPLIRYRTGDYAAMYRETCPCGRVTQRIGPIVGRKNHKLKLKGTTIFPSSLQIVLDSANEVLSYVIIITKEADLSDSVEVRIACAGDKDKILSKLRDHFQGEAKVVPKITIASREEIESLQMPDGARKRRFLVDLRT